MYQGELTIYLCGLDDESVEALRGVPALAPFTHDLVSTPDFDAHQAAEADLTLVSLGMEVDTWVLQDFLEDKDDHCDVIALVASERSAETVGLLPELSDVWPDGMPADELVWRFERWQRLRKARADAQETSQFLEVTINSIPCLIWYKTADGIHEKVNDSFCETVGKEKDDVQGRGHAYIWDVEADDPACIESEAQVMATRKTCVSEEVVQSGKDTKLLTTYKSPLYNLDGTVMGTVGVAIDVTQERAYERDLLQKNQTLESIFRAMECGVLTHSLDGTRVIGVNQAALSILGYESEEDLLAHGFDMVADSVVDEDKEMLREKFATLENAGDSVSFEYGVRHTDGTILHVIGSAKLVEQDGELFYQRFLLDYSDQKREEEIRERRQQSFIRALSEDHLVMCSFDLDTGEGELLRISDEADDELRDIFGGELTYEDALNKYVSQRVLPEDQETLHEALVREKVLAELEERKRCTVMFRSLVDGVMGYRQATLVRAGSWADDAGDDHFMVLGLRNVDRETREEIERKEQLEEALQRANRANEAKSLFLSNMSHDIRTPMNAIIGFTTLATNHLDDVDRVADYLEKIQTSSAHLLDLINDILDMSRIESGKASLEEKPCNLAEIMERLSSIVQPEVDAKGLTYAVDLSNLRDSLVMCDELKVKQVLLNILGNAVKFTPSGGTVSLVVNQVPSAIEGRDDYTITIADSGIGMDEAFIEHIFDPFERERTSTLSGTQGTGLGMAIARRLVDMMDGSIEVTSVKGEGSTFAVTLPLTRLANPAEHGHDDARRAPRELSERLRGLRILLVDDNMLNREIATTLLEDAGFEVDQAIDGRDAIDRLSTADPGHYQLVLMDIQMPVMNGYEAAAIVRSMDDPVLSRIPILAVTADAFDEDRQKALDSGMDGHIAKPIEIDDLLSALEGVLLPE